MAQKAMTGHHYKTPGLIRAGFQYQDLVAVEILINFYRKRNLYAWVKLDAEDQVFSIDRGCGRLQARWPL